MKRSTGSVSPPARRAVVVAFLVHAATFATWAARIPAIRDRLELNHDQLGIALGGLAVGMFVGTRLTTRAEQAGRTGRPMQIAVPLLAIGVVGPGFATDLVTFTAALFAFGLVGGYLDVVMNAHAVAVERVARRPMMSGFHGMWSVGAMGGSAVAALVARADIDVRLQFTVTAVVLSLVSAPFLRSALTPEEERSTQNQPDGHPAARAVNVPLVAVVIIAIMGLGSFMVEGSVADWSALLLSDQRHASPGVAALGLTVFAGCMAISRLTGDRAGLRYGPVRLARGGAIVALIGFAMISFAPSAAPTLLGFAIMGFGVGPVVPTVFSAAGNTSSGRRTSVLGPTVSAGYVGGTIGPIVIGFIAEHVELSVALAFPAAFLLVVVFGARLLRTASGPAPEAHTTVFHT